MITSSTLINIYKKTNDMDDSSYYFTFACMLVSFKLIAVATLTGVRALCVNTSLFTSMITIGALIDI